MSKCNSIKWNSIENSYLTYYQKTRDVVLSKAKDYYKNNKERLRIILYVVNAFITRMLFRVKKVFISCKYNYY